MGRSNPGDHIRKGASGDRRDSDGVIVLSTVVIFIVSAPVSTPHWQTLRSRQFGFQLRHPASHTVEVSGGHSPLAHPQYLARFSITPKTQWTPESAHIDIDVANARQFSNTRAFVKTEFDGRLRPEGKASFAGSTHTLYSFQGYHFVFISHGRYILAFSGPSRRFLLAVAVTLRLQRVARISL